MEQDRVIRAADVMHSGLVTIDGMATAHEAVEKMRTHKMSSLLVEKRNADDAWGIISLQDLLQGVLAAGRASQDVNVYEIMTKPVITVPADMNIRYVAQLLRRFAIRRVPVEDKGELVGMISLSSLVLENELF